MSDWIILRTAGRSTLNLAETLGQDGFEVWTPVETRTMPIPRKNVKRTIKLPIMPSYVFARALHLIDLIQMAAMPFKPRRASGRPAHPDFSVMHFCEGIPTIGELQLEALRYMEAKLTPRARAEITFAAGIEVKVKTEGGSFGGMKGVVRRSDHGLTLVCFDGRMSVKIPTSLLEQDQLCVEAITRLKAA